MPMSVQRSRGTVGEFLNKTHDKHRTSGRTPTAPLLLPQKTSRHAPWLAGFYGVLLLSSTLAVVNMPAYLGRQRATPWRKNSSSTECGLQTHALCTERHGASCLETVTNAPEIKQLPFCFAAAATAADPQQDEVTAVRIDTACIEQRADISLSDVLRKIADTLAHPVTELARESQVLLTYMAGGGCPSAESAEKISSVTSVIDKFLHRVTEIFPRVKEIVLLRTVVAPVLRMCADYIDNKDIKAADIYDINSEILSFARSVTDLLPYNIGRRGPDAIIPKHLIFDYSGLFVSIDNEQWRLMKKDNLLYATNEYVSRRVGYDEQHERWEFVNQDIERVITENDDAFYHLCPIKSLGRHSRHHRPCLGLGKDAGNHTITCLRASPDSFERMESDTLAPQRLLNRLDIGLNVNSFLVDKISLHDGREIYRVRNNDKLASPYYHAINVNGVLVPVRAKIIYQDYLHCEAYDLQETDTWYPVEYNEGCWRFELATSPHVADNLRNIITPDSFAKNIDERALSMPDTQGIKRDNKGAEYLKINGGFIRLAMLHDRPMVVSPLDERFHLRYIDNKFNFISAELKKRTLAVTARQYEMDHCLRSSAGMSLAFESRLNEEWTLLRLNARVSSFKRNDRIGSIIEITFRLLYRGFYVGEFIDLPVPQWITSIKCEGDEKVWSYTLDRFKASDRSPLLSLWHRRYIAAYHFVKAPDNAGPHGHVHLYDINLQPVLSRELPNATDPQQQSDAVKHYLKRHGGILDITLAESYSVNLHDRHDSEERVTRFTIGFRQQGSVMLNQGISVQEGIPEHLFVSTSDNIKLAQSDINALPPAPLMVAGADIL